MKLTLPTQKDGLTLPKGKSQLKLGGKGRNVPNKGEETYIPSLPLAELYPDAAHLIPAKGETHNIFTETFETVADWERAWELRIKQAGANLKLIQGGDDPNDDAPMTEAEKESLKKIIDSGGREIWRGHIQQQPDTSIIVVFQTDVHLINFVQAVELFWGEETADDLIARSVGGKILLRGEVLFEMLDLPIITEVPELTQGAKKSLPAHAQDIIATDDA